MLGRSSQGGKGLRGERGKGSQPEKRGRILGRKREKDLRGRKALGSKRGGKISTGKGGKDLREERGGKILGRKGRRSGGKRP